MLSQTQIQLVFLALALCFNRFTQMLAALLIIGNVFNNIAISNMVIGKVLQWCARLLIKKFLK